MLIVIVGVYFIVLEMFFDNDIIFGVLIGIVFVVIYVFWNFIYRKYFK